VEPTRRIFGVPAHPAADVDPANADRSGIASRPLSRRAVIGGGLAGLGGLLLSPSQLLAKAAVPDDYSSFC
jgi:hypothetical protein